MSNRRNEAIVTDADDDSDDDNDEYNSPEKLFGLPRPTPTTAATSSTARATTSTASTSTRRVVPDEGDDVGMQTSAVPPAAPTQKKRIVPDEGDEMQGEPDQEEPPPPRVHLVGNAPPPPRKPARKTRAELTTATAIPEVIERRKPTYNPLEVDAPLDPDDEYVDQQFDGDPLKFKYDKFATGRKVHRKFLHGKEAELQFDAEQFDLLPATKANQIYKDKVRGQRLGQDRGFEPLLEAELEAAVVEETPQAVHQYRTDIQNEDFIKAIRGNVVRSATNLTEIERERLLASSKSAKERQQKLYNAFLKNIKDTHSNPEFYTGYSDYIAEKDAAQKTAEELYDEEKAAKEKKKIVTPIEAAASKEKHLKSDGELVIITKEDAAQILEVNPLSRLDSTMHDDFMAIPEISQITILLRSWQLKHERYRNDVNAVEFVRAMNLKGAKYDGCVKMRVKRSLYALLDKKFYEPFIDHQQKCLLGGHEHFNTKTKETILVVFKFFCVLRNPENTSRLSKYSVVDDASTNILNTDAYKTNAQSTADPSKTLSRAGYLDYNTKKPSDVNAELDKNGSMHYITDLAKEMMFVVRVVLVEPEPAGTGKQIKDTMKLTQEHADYASLDDEDFVIPRVVRRSAGKTPTAVPKPTAGTASTRRANNNNDDDDNDDDVGGSRNNMREDSFTAGGSITERLQQSQFNDNEEGEAPELSSQPREVTISDVTGVTTTSTTSRKTQHAESGRSNSSRTGASNSLFGGDAGSESDENDADDVELQNLSAPTRTPYRAPVSHYKNTSRHGVRFEDIHDDDDDDDVNDDDFAIDAAKDVVTPTKQKSKPSTKNNNDDDGDVMDRDEASAEYVPIVRPQGKSAARHAVGLESEDNDDTDDSQGGKKKNKYDDEEFHVHTDDENSETRNNRRFEDEADDSAEKFLPENKIQLTLKQAMALVGVETRAKDFMQKVNSGYLKRLCFRSFSFYAVPLPAQAKHQKK